MKTKRDTINNRPITVLPGDDLTDHILPPTDNNDNNSNSQQQQQQKEVQTPKLGKGLTYNSTTHKITTTLAGRLFHNHHSNIYYILANTKRYIPNIHDRILCIVEERMGDFYRVTIPSSSVGSALLNTCSFEGATRRNKPNLTTGSLVYARISVCNIRIMEPEVTCIARAGEGSTGQGGGGSQDGGASRKDWMTNEGTYGELKGGSCITVSLGLARELLRPRNVVLDALDRANIPFEICIGVNGMVWVHSHRAEWTILILNAIQNSEIMTEDQVRTMVKKLATTVRETLIQED